MAITSDLTLLITSKILPLACSIIGFGLLVVVHECGHFLFCKLFGIYTPTFSIGFGPKLIERKIGQTNFCLSAIPFGGYVEIAGLEEVGQGDQAFAQSTGGDAFSSKSYWQKMLVLMGGIIFNLCFAYLVFCGLFMIGNQQHIQINSIAPQSAAATYGLQAGDEIMSITTQASQSSETVQEQRIVSSNHLLKEIQDNPNQEISLRIKRNNEEQTIALTLGSQETNGKTVGLLGASFNQNQPIEKLPFLQAIQRGIKETNTWIVAIAHSMKSIFTRNMLSNAGGPVRILAEGFKMAQSGLAPLFIFLAFMSINLALFNLLPLGITDGGQLFFTTLEFIIRRPVPSIMRNAMNIVSFALFVFLAIFLTYNDVVSLFGAKLAWLYGKAVALIK